MAENGTVGQIHLGTIIFLHFLKVHFSYLADYRAEVLGVFLSTKPPWGEKHFYACYYEELTSRVSFFHISFRIYVIQNLK